MFIDDWTGCYPSKWKGMIVDEAMAHPAKFSSRLIRRIYEHMFAEGWLAEGDVVIDPFGGVALGALDAMRLGLRWRGMELEARFVDLGNQNIAFWNQRFRSLPKWSGKAALLQGDSRNLLAVLEKGSEATISSPPYADSLERPNGIDITKSHHCFGPHSQGELDTRYSAAISSPPYAEARVGQESGQEHCGRGDQYRATEGQLGAMKTGGFEAAVSSPPFRQTSGGAHIPKGMEVSDPGLAKRHAAGNAASKAYGKTEGQLANMDEGDFQAAVSSPPFENCEGRQARRKFKDPEAFARTRSERYASGQTKGHSASPEAILRSMEKAEEEIYGNTDGNIGNQNGDDFWLAARQIVEQVFLALGPGGHAVWVCKDFVKDKRRQPFCDQWRQLCEAVGFVTLHEHHALLVRHNGTSITLEGEKIEHTTESKSFFRRLAEKKGSPRIDYEVVFCMAKPAEGWE